MAFLSSCWAWVLAHPVFVLASWPIFTGLVNVVFGAANKYADKHPKAHAVLDLFETAGLDARGVIAWVAKRLPSAPAAMMLVVVSAVGTSTVMLACGTSTPGASSPNPEAAKCVAHRTVRELECVDLYETKADIDACRDKVKAQIDCVDGGATDGGGQ